MIPNIRYFPITTVLLTIITVTVTLLLTFSQGHVSGIPYISDTGTLPPESCIFGQALNLLWVMISYAMYIKYLQTEYLFSKYSIRDHQTTNKGALFVGLLAAFGSSVVGNFQETNMFLVHWFGAVLVFGFGSIYQCMQTVLYIHLIPVLGQKKMTNFRIALSIISVASFLIFFTCGMISYSQKEVNDGYLHWKKVDGGYDCHNISVIFEWVCGSSTMVYLTSFSEEFKKIIVQNIDVITEDGNCQVEQIYSISEKK